MAEPAEMVAEVQREIALRRRVYPRWVAAGRMKLDRAERGIAVMEAVAAAIQAASSAPAEEWTGEIRRANAEGSEIRGFLVTGSGKRIALAGHKDPRPGQGYFLFGRTVVAEAPDGEG